MSEHIHEVFLSHSSSNAEFAEKLAQTLRAHGVPVWFSTTNIRGAKQWHDEIGNALKRCDWFAVLLSSDAVSSMWVKRELIFALQQRRLENRIIPILLHDCDYENLSWTLGAFELICFSPCLEEGLRQLLRVWGLGYDPGLGAFGTAP